MDFDFEQVIADLRRKREQLSQIFNGQAQTATERDRDVATATPPQVPKVERKMDGTGGPG